ncbi:MAG: hypothetical protein CYPHOPRED_005904 [Cyphobasidiales sp. Tagirdzhanova-0007]|nr:MAG: hypothetical protein CYPHOPRED_005904 [Cyphobasidiales sp. Tagirdzhanova-0007]
MPHLPWDILRLVLDQLSSDYWPEREDGRSRSALLNCALVSKEFAQEVQSVLFRDIDLSRFYKYRHPLYWAFSSPNRDRLCSYVQVLHLPCVALQKHIAAVIGACSNLRSLWLQVSHAEDRDCLMECIQGALLPLKKLTEIRLLHPTSIRALSIVYNLPYRLGKLYIAGLYGYTHSLWDNPYEYIDVEEVHFAKSRMSEHWDDHFFYSLLEHELVKAPLSVLRIESSHCHFEFIPAATASNIRVLEVREAQQLLKLDHLERFPNLERLGLGARHNFISLTSSLPQIKHLTIYQCNEGLLKLLSQWLDRGQFCNLETVTFTEGALNLGSRAAEPVYSNSARLEEVIRCRNIRCIPSYTPVLAEIPKILKKV